jgi:hypothetical protein
MLILGLLLALPQPVLAETVPKPRLRPTEGAVAPGPAATIPMPRLRPSPAQPEESAPEESTPAAPPPPEPRSWTASELAEALDTCRKLLEGLDIDYEHVDPLGEPGGCGAPAPVSVSRVSGVALAPSATFTCDMAAALHGWVTDTLKPQARQRLKTEVTAINTASSYVCRRRNNSSSGKMSEHSKANALDIAGFTFAEKGKDVAVGGGKWGEGILASLGVSKDGSFLEAIRKGACAHFTTVLGPGSDPYHGDHIHVDVLRRKGDYRICQ